MSIKFRVSKKVLPGSKKTEELYAATLLKSESIGMEEISEALSDASTLNSIDCYAVMHGMTQQIIKHLLLGNVVNIEGLGSFRITARSRGVSSARDVTANTISAATVNFRPSVEVKKQLRRAKFVKQE